MGTPGQHLKPEVKATLRAELLANPDEPATRIALRLGVDKSTAQQMRREMAERGEYGTKPTMPAFRISQATAVTNEDGDVVREFIQQKPERGEEYQPTDGMGLAGKTTWVDVVGEERIVTREVFMERRAAGDAPLQEIIEAVRGAFEDYRGSAPNFPAPDIRESEAATVYPLADWHIGLLAWGREAGEDWDLQKAEADIKTAMERLVAASPASQTAVVLGLGDLLHSDGYANATARSGNKLDVDGRYPKVLTTATRLVLYTIDLALQKHQRVIVRLIPGNHDDQSAIAVSLALATRFEGHERVTIDDDPGRFWWWRWGKCFLGAAHGDMAEMKELPLIMASRHPEDWGATTHKMIFTGHIHHREKLNAKEFGGVDVESFNSPAGKDAWQAGMGFVSKRSVHSITFHSVDGEVMRNRAVILSR